MISKRLREVRLAFGLTQKEMAEIAETAHSAVCFWESGERDVPHGKLELICAELNIPMAYFLEGKGRIETRWVA